MNRTRKLQNLKHLAFVHEGGYAPPGWAEIQRNDSLDTGPDDLRPLESDDEAAVLVAERAGMPGCAMAYHRASDTFWRLVRSEPDGSVEARISNEEAERLEIVDDVNLPAWIAVVPARAAYEAGFVTRKHESRALRVWT